MFGDLFNAVIKTVTLPIQVVKDVGEVVVGGEVSHTKDTLSEIEEDIFGF